MGNITELKGQISVRDSDKICTTIRKPSRNIKSGW